MARNQKHRGQCTTGMRISTSLRPQNQNCCLFSCPLHAPTAVAATKLSKSATSELGRVPYLSLEAPLAAYLVLLGRVGMIRLAELLPALLPTRTQNRPAHVSHDSHSPVHRGDKSASREDKPVTQPPDSANGALEARGIPESDHTPGHQVCVAEVPQRSFSELNLLLTPPQARLVGLPPNLAPSGARGPSGLTILCPLLLIYVGPVELALFLGRLGVPCEARGLGVADDVLGGSARAEGMGPAIRARVVLLSIVEY